MRLIFYMLVTLISLSSAHAQQMTDKEKVDYHLNRLDMNSFLPSFEGMTNELIDLHEIALPKLIEIARDEDEDEPIRINSIYIIGRMGENSEKAVATLTRIVSSRTESNEIRAIAIGALGRIGKKAFSSVTILNNQLYSEDPWIAEQAERALKSINTVKTNELLQQYYFNKKIPAQPVSTENPEEKSSEKNEEDSQN